MSLTPDQLQRIARLARIRVGEEEQDSLAGELNQIMTWIEQLNEVNTDGVQPMTGVGATKLPLREDKVTDGGYPEKVLANAPEGKDGFFTVPKVVE